MVEKLIVPEAKAFKFEKLKKAIPNLTVEMVDDLVRQHRENLGSGRFPKEVTDQITKVFGDANFVYLHQDNVYLILKKGNDFFSYSVSQAVFKKQGFKPLLEKVFKSQSGIKQTKMKFTHKSRTYELTVGKYASIYYGKLFSDAYKMGISPSILYLNTFGKGVFPNFNSKVVSTQLVQLVPKRKPPKYAEATLVTDIQVRFGQLGVAATQEQLTLMRMWSQGLWKDKGWQAYPKADQLKETYPHKRTGGFSFVILKGSNLHLFYSKGKNYVELVLQVKKGNVFEAFNSYFDYLKSDSHMKDATLAIHLDAMAQLQGRGLPATEANLQRYKQAYVNSQIAVLSLYQKALRDKTLKQGQIYTVTIDVDKTKAPGKDYSALGFTDRVQQWEHRIYFIAHTQAQALQKAQLYKQYQEELARRARFGDEGTPVEYRRYATEKGMVTEQAAIASLKGKIDEMVVRDRKGGVKGVSAEGKAIIAKYVSDRSYRAYQPDPKLVGKVAGIQYLRASKLELQAMDDAIRAYKKGDSSKFMELILSYQFWSDMKHRAGKAREAHPHIHQLMVILMYKLQKSGILGKQGFVGLAARHTSKPDVLAEEFKIPEDILKRAKPRGRPRQSINLEGIGILQTWQNTMLDQLRGRGFDIDKALTFLNLGEEYHLPPGQKPRTPVQKYLYNRGLFLKALESGKLTGKHVEAIRYFIRTREPHFIRSLGEVWPAVKEGFLSRDKDKWTTAMLMVKNAFGTDLSPVIGTNPVDFHLGPMTLTAFAFLSVSKSLEPKPPPALKPIVASQTSLNYLRHTTVDSSGTMLSEQEATLWFREVDPKLGPIGDSVSYLEYLEREGIVTKEYIELYKLKHDKAPKVKAKDINAETHYHGLLISRSLMPGSTNEYGYFVVNPDPAVRSKGLQYVYNGYLDIRTGKLYSYDPETFAIDRSKALATLRVHVGGNRIHIDLPSSLDFSDFESFPPKLKQMFIAQVDDRKFRIPNYGVRDTSSRRMPQNVLHVVGYVKRKEVKK